MKGTVTKFFQALLCITLVLVMLIPICVSVKAETYTEGVDDEGLNPIYKYYSGSLVTYNDLNQSYIFQTENVTKSGSTYYHTMGYEFSRIVAGTDDTYYDANGDREYVFFSISELEEIEYNRKNGTTIASYVLPLNTLLERIKTRDSGWYDEIMATINAGETAYVGVDAVIEMIYNGKDYITVFTNPDGTYRVIPSKATIYRWNNYTELYNIGWSKPEATNAGIRDHYGKIIPLGMPMTNAEVDDSKDPYIKNPTTSMIIKKDYDDTNTTTSASGNRYASPTTYAYNTSDVFDLADGIPASETYTNGIDISSWYGSVGVSKITQYYEVAVNYSIDVKYPVVSMSTWHSDFDLSGESASEGSSVMEYADGRQNADGTWYGTTTLTSIQKKRYAGTYTYVFENTYYGLNSVNLYELAKADVYNDSVGVTTYNVDPNIQYNITIANENVNSAAGTYFNATSFTTEYDVESDPHVTLPLITEADRVYTETLDYDYSPSSEEIRAYVEAQINLRFSDKELTVKNDTLELNGRQYMDEDNIYFDFIGGSQLSIGAESNDHVREEKVVTIPEDEANGIYYTTLVSTYRTMAAMNSQRTITLEDTANDTSYPAIHPDYKQNEPVVVHSPVIAPISIGGEIQTQAKQASSVASQLILDNTYTVDFVWNRYFMMKGYDMPAGWTKYIKDKLVRFPFAVEVNGVFYEPITDEILAGEAGTDAGYTEWISVGAVESFDFYLPSWAEEGVYGSTGVGDDALYNYNPNPIQVKCLANNYIVDTPQIGEEYEWNEELNNYAATYEYPVQVSGVLYDFTALAVNDEASFGDIDYSMGCWQFFMHNQDKKVGCYNRFGNESQRYYWTGLLEDDWLEVNTLPFTNGKSNALSEMGYLTKGSLFSFSFKTIANLNGENDTVKITPSYRYIAPDGTVYEEDEFNLYYTVGTDIYVPMGSAQDELNTYTVALGSKWFELDLYDFRTFDKAQYTADTFNRTLQELLFSETPSYNLGSITLYSTQKLLSGDEEELEVNQYNDGNSVIRYNTAGGLGNLSGSTYDDFKQSMQTWYGKYQIPNDLFVALKRDGAAYEDDYIQAREEGEAVSDSSDCWQEGGYLVLNFDIVTYKDGQYEHLRYYNDIADVKWLDMWGREQGMNAPTETVTTSGTANATIQLRTGDVAVINMTRRYSERFYVGIQYIN